MMTSDAPPHAPGQQARSRETANGAARTGPPRNVQPPATVTERVPAASVTQDSSHAAKARAEAAQLVRQYAPDTTGEEIIELLSRYQQIARNLPAYVHGRRRHGHLGPDLAEIRASMEKARTARAVDELRASGAKCEHGAAGGLDAHPVTGLPMCALCRAEGRTANPAAAAASPEPGPADAEPGQGRRVTLIAASQIAPRPVRWGWHGRLPAGHVGLIPGREGIGKSLLLIWLTALVTLGKLPGAFHGTPRAVFYSASEDSWAHTIVPRLIAAGADLRRVYRVAVEVLETGTFTQLYLPRDCDLLAAGVKAKDAAMVAFDPLMSVLDPGIDTHHDRELRTALEPLGKVAEETGCMIVGVAHFNKSAGDDPLSLVTGSRAFTAVVRSVIAIAKDPEAADGRCVISQVKNNLGRLDLPNLAYVVESAEVPTAEGKAETARIRMMGETEKSVRDILSDPATASDRTERARCAEWLREILADGPKRTREILDEAQNVHGFAPRTVQRARQETGVKAIQKNSGPKCGNEWWLILPETGQTAQVTQAAT
jgi:hypothetical protein